eukprot:g81163.t1
MGKKGMDDIAGVPLKKKCMYCPQKTLPSPAGVYEPWERQHFLCHNCRSSLIDMDWSNYVEYDPRLSPLTEQWNLIRPGRVLPPTQVWGGVILNDSAAE